MLIAAKIGAYLGLLITIGSGLLLLLRPHFLATMGLTAATPAAVSELRTIGGMLIGLTVAAFVFSGTGVTYALLAAGWAGATLVRFVSFFADRATLRDIGGSIILDLFAAACFATAAIYAQ